MRNVLAVLALCFAGPACSPSQRTEVDLKTTLDRAVSVATTACGHASKTSGAGVIIGDNRVLASAHVVIGAETLEVDGAAAQILKLDTQADLALLEVVGVVSDPLEYARASPGEKLTIIGGGPSGSFSASVLRPVEVRIEEVRSTTRSSRLGYELDVRVALGDSGAGVFNSAGRLVGIVFGRIRSDSNRSFIVQSTEVVDFLADGSEAVHECDPDLHRVMPVADN